MVHPKNRYLLTYYVHEERETIQTPRFPRRTPITHPLSNGMHLPFLQTGKYYPHPDTPKWTPHLSQSESIAYVAGFLIDRDKRYSTPYPISDPRQYRKSLQMMKEHRIKYILLAHHGIHEVAVETWDTLIRTVGDKPKNHLNTIRKWLRLL